MGLGLGGSAIPPDCVSIMRLYSSHGKTHGTMGIPMATVPLVTWGFQAKEASMQLRSWDKVVQMRPDFV